MSDPDAQTIQPAPPAAAAALPPSNPWTITIGVLGFLAIGVGLLLMLIPSTDSYGLSTDQLDLTRILAGLACTSIGGTLVTCWLVLGGMGWYLRQR